MRRKAAKFPLSRGLLQGTVSQNSLSGCIPCGSAELAVSHHRLWASSGQCGDTLPCVVCHFSLPLIPFSSLLLPCLSLDFPNKAWTLKSCLWLGYLRNQVWHHSRALSTLARAEALIFHWICKESYLETNIKCCNIPSVIQGYFRAVTLKATKSVSFSITWEVLRNVNSQLVGLRNLFLLLFCCCCCCFKVLQVIVKKVLESLF